MLGSIFEHSASTGDFVLTAGAALAAIAVRALCTTSAAKASFRAAQSVKQRLRPIIYEKRPAKTAARRAHGWAGRVRLQLAATITRGEIHMNALAHRCIY